MSPSLRCSIASAHTHTHTLTCTWAHWPASPQLCWVKRSSPKATWRGTKKWNKTAQPEPLSFPLSLPFVLRFLFFLSLSRTLSHCRPASALLNTTEAENMKMKGRERGGGRGDGGGSSVTWVTLALPSRMVHTYTHKHTHPTGAREHVQRGPNMNTNNAAVSEQISSVCIRQLLCRFLAIIYTVH